MLERTRVEWRCIVESCCRLQLRGNSDVRAESLRTQCFAQVNLSRVRRAYVAHALLVDVISRKRSR
ncbi:MAG: hypothetical protein DWH97_01720 [Planctomycetota bacterium]|nr:MAG: hypothetical protein DWH97_01720 [Planctomycetota bacterium]